MKKRIGLIALVGVAVILSAGLRGCWDFTKPTPWVAEARQPLVILPPAAR